MKRKKWRDYTLHTVLFVFFILRFIPSVYGAESPTIPDSSFPGTTDAGFAGYIQGFLTFIVGAAGLVAFFRIIIWQGKSSLQESVQNQEGKRNAIKEVLFGTLMLCGIGMIIYLFYGNNFTITLPTLDPVPTVGSLIGPGITGVTSTANCGTLYCVPKQQICDSPGHCIPDPTYGKTDPCAGIPDTLCPPTKTASGFQMTCTCGKLCTASTNVSGYECRAQ